MNHTPNVEILRKWYGTQDRNLMHPDCVWEIAEGFPHGGVYSGSKALFEQFFPSLLADFEDWHAEVEEILDASDLVLGIGRYRGRARATGIQVSIPFAHLWKVRDGQILWARQYTDTFLVRAAIA